jgi:Skp family chaperone for outer membrane proteins
MKKILSLLALVSASFACRAGELVSIDSLAIMQKSAEGKELIGKIQKEVDSFKEEVTKAQKNLAEQQESLGKQAKVLSQEAVQEKKEALEQSRKKLEREFADKEEALRGNIQRKQMALREKQLAVINEVFEKEGWTALIDKNTPGLLCVSTAIDKTDVVLKAVDAKFQVKAPAKAAKPTIKAA